MLLNNSSRIQKHCIYFKYKCFVTQLSLLFKFRVSLLNKSINFLKKKKRVDPKLFEQLNSKKLNKISKIEAFSASFGPRCMSHYGSKMCCKVLTIIYLIKHPHFHQQNFPFYNRFHHSCINLSLCPLQPCSWQWPYGIRRAAGISSASEVFTTSQRSTRAGRTSGRTSSTTTRREEESRTRYSINTGQPGEILIYFQ